MQKMMRTNATAYQLIERNQMSFDKKKIAGNFNAWQLKINNNN